MEDSVIAILTDFGLHDSYVGIMKGVILQFHPTARIIDLTHEIPPGDIWQGGFELWRAFRYLPEKTVILAVVDPGVGTDRRPIAVQLHERILVGPDNGLFTMLMTTEEVQTIIQLHGDFELPWTTSRTFHGRDIFAPAAALIAAGRPLSELGDPIDDPIQIELPNPETTETGIRGQVVFVDGFGNLVTNIGVLQRQGKWLFFQSWLEAAIPVRLDPASCQAVLPDGLNLPVLGSFGDVDPGEVLAYIGSSGLLEIGLNGGNAAESLGMNIGSEVFLRVNKG